MTGLQDIIIIILGSSVLASIISAIATRKNTKDDNDIKLLDRNFVEIDRLDSRIKELEIIKSELKKELAQKDFIIKHTKEDKERLSQELNKARVDLENVLRELSDLKEELRKIESKIK